MSRKSKKSSERELQRLRNLRRACIVVNSLGREHGLVRRGRPAKQKSSAKSVKKRSKAAIKAERLRNLEKARVARFGKSSKKAGGGKKKSQTAIHAERMKNLAKARAVRFGLLPKKRGPGRPKKSPTLAGMGPLALTQRAANMPIIIIPPNLRGMQSAGRGRGKKIALRKQ